ncbi:MAG: head morphogenesis protein, partial [Bacteroidales bacterium]|nr:head morphogenesis protein [Bacteroidales bacterium]
MVRLKAAAEPRNDHQRLYGVVKPVDDPFWDTWLPPSDWGCRCSVKQVRDDDNAKEVPKDIKLPPAYMR